MGITDSSGNSVTGKKNPFSIFKRLHWNPCISTIIYFVDASGNPVTQSVVSVTDSSGNPVTGKLSKQFKILNNNQFKTWSKLLCKCLLGNINK